MLSLDQVRKAVPANLRGNVTQALVDRINQVEGDPIATEAFRENFISYARVLGEGRFKVTDYLDAVRYVSFKLLGDSNQDAWAKTFPERYQRLVEKGADGRQISSYASAYNKGKLVNLIVEQSLVPSWVLNQDVYQEAINTLATIMVDEDFSGMVRVKAAESLLVALQKPKEAGPLVNIDMRENAGLVELRSLLSEAARREQEEIRSGVPTEQIAARKLIVVEHGE